MCFVVRESDGKILNSIDAWETNSVERMYQWAADNGYSVICGETTSLGNMIIYVR